MHAQDTARSAASATGPPPELTALPQWVCWRQEERNGKATKPPINPRTGRPASTTDPTTWSDHATAKAAVRRYRCHGVGFVFTAEDPFVGIDLDGGYDPETGRPTDWAAPIVAAFNSYTEISPSGRGLHILIQGRLPGHGRKQGPIEVYDRRRFFTVTGQRIHP